MSLIEVLGHFEVYRSGAKVSVKCTDGCVWVRTFDRIKGDSLAQLAADHRKERHQ